MKNQAILKRKAISKKTRFEVFKRDKFTCQFCGKSAPDHILEIDHLKPVASGGDNNLLNLVTSCYDCNRGKSKNGISNDSFLKKQLSQLEVLEEKRQQLELLAKWRTSLSDLDKEYLRFYQKLFKKLSKLDYTFNGDGKNTILKLRKQFSDEEIVDAADTSFRQYYNFPTNEAAQSEQWNKAFNYIPKILQVRKKAKNNPEIQELYYIRGILRKKAKYQTDWQILNYLKNLVESGFDIEDIKGVASSCYNWSDFTNQFSK